MGGGRRVIGRLVREEFLHVAIMISPIPFDTVEALMGAAHFKVAFECDGFLSIDELWHVEVGDFDRLAKA